MSEEETIKFLEEYKKTGYTTLYIKNNGDRHKINRQIEEAIQDLLDLYQKEKEKNKQLEKIIRIIRNKLKYKVIIEENGIYKPCKNLSKQEVYKDYEEIIDLLKADYCFMDNETAIKEILKENGVN